MADETERQKKIAAALLELVDQIERNDFRDSHGHDLKMLKAYQDVKTLVTAPLRR